MVFVLVTNFAILGGLLACLAPCLVNIIACFCITGGIAGGGLEIRGSALWKYSIGLGAIVVILLIIVAAILLYLTEKETTETLIISLIVTPLVIAGMSLIIYLCGYSLEKYLDHRRKINVENSMNRHKANIAHYHNILFVGNNIITNDMLFKQLRILENNNNISQYYKQLLLKYIIKNMQSLIIQSLHFQSETEKKNNKWINNNRNKSFDKILSISTFGTDWQNILENHKNILQHILNVWTNPMIQNIIHPENTENYQSINMNTINDDVIVDINVNTEFLEYFMNDRDIKSMILSQKDINIIQYEHEYYLDALYHGRDEILIKLVYKCLLYDAKFGSPSKWFQQINDSIKAVVYVMDLSIFNSIYQNNLKLINYWYSDCFQILNNHNNNIPFQIEQVLTSYFYSDFIQKDIASFLKYNAQNINNKQMIHCVLFVNYDQFSLCVKKYRINFIKSFFHSMEIDMDKIDDIDDDKVLYQYLSKQYFKSFDHNLDFNNLHFKIDDINDIESVQHLLSIFKSLVE